MLPYSPDEYFNSFYKAIDSAKELLQNAPSTNDIWVDTLSEFSYLHCKNFEDFLKLLKKLLLSSHKKKLQGSIQHEKEIQSQLTILEQHLAKTEEELFAKTGKTKEQISAHLFMQVFLRLPLVRSETLAKQEKSKLLVKFLIESKNAPGSPSLHDFDQIIGGCYLSTTQGRRGTQEDYYCCIENTTLSLKKPSETVVHLRESLHKIAGDYTADTTGAILCLAHYHANYRTLTIAQVGHQHALLLALDEQKDSKVTTLCFEHRPNDYLEKAMIEQHGGKVVYKTSWKIETSQGSIDLSRTFGNHGLTMISREAEISQIRTDNNSFTGKRLFLLLSSFGAFEQLTNQDYATLLSHLEKTGQHLENYARTARNIAYAAGSKHNITFLMTELTNHQERKDILLGISSGYSLHGSGASYAQGLIERIQKQFHN